MKLSRFILVAGVAALMLSPLSAQNLDAELQRAIQKEVVGGDLKAAIEAYKRIVTMSGTDRAMAAKALLRMAQTYGKMGDAEGERILARIIQDYPDQPDVAAAARARLQVPARSEGPRNTFIRNGGSLVSPNGRYLAYREGGSYGSLYLDDLATGETRRPFIAAESDAFPKQIAFSHDGKHVVYSWRDRIADTDHLRIAEVGAGRTPSSRVLFQNDDIPNISHIEESPDGRYVAANLQRKDRTVQIGLITVADGSLRILQSIDWQGTGRLSFSPDSRFLGFDLAVSDMDRQRDVFVLAVDGSKRSVAVASPYDDRMVDWTPDGSRILFYSDRMGSSRLWSVAVNSAGGPEGPPQVIQPAILWSPGARVTSSGALFYGAATDQARNQLASFDFATGRLLSSPVDLTPGPYPPAWSRDGKALAYQSDGIIIRSVENDRPIRHLHPALVYFNNLKWSPDGSAFAVNGSDSQGRRGIYRIDAATGEAGVLVRPTASEDLAVIDWAPEGRRVYYLRDQGARSGATIVAREVPDGTEREVLQQAGLWSSILSPDGRLLALSIDDRTKTSRSVQVASIHGGGPRVLLTDNQSRLSAVMWAPDGQAVFVIKQTVEGTQELWQVSLSGGPRKVEGEWRTVFGTPFSVRPDGKEIAFVARMQGGVKFWKVENFLPRPILKR